MRNIDSDAVHQGRNADEGTWKDDRYIKCGRCGFVAHLDRDLRVPKGARAGQGRTQTSTTLDGAVTAGDTTISVDSTTGFPTPSTGSITAFTERRGGVIVTSSDHGITGGFVTISSTTSYNGTFPISAVTTDTFVIHTKFVADDATGTWIRLEYFIIYDAGSYATVDSSTTKYDVSSTYTAATNGPRATRVSYTAISSNDFTGCVGANGHDDGMNVRSEVTTPSGCPFCGVYTYDTGGFK